MGLSISEIGVSATEDGVDTALELVGDSRQNTSMSSN